MLNELQGESGYEGELCVRAVGLMSFERMVSLAPSHTSLFSVVLRTWRGDIVALWDDLASSDSHSALPDSCVHAPFRAPTCHSMGVPSIVFSAILSPPYRPRALTFLHSAYSVRKLTYHSFHRPNQPSILANTTSSTEDRPPDTLTMRHPSHQDATTDI